MPLVEVPIPNLLGGVSMQPPANRQPGQLERCDNALLHVVNGLGKRKGTRHLAQLIAGDESVRQVHFIDRGEGDRYVALIGERRLRVFSAESGIEFPVKVNGTSTDIGRGAEGTGTPVAYLDPRTPQGIVDQDEDFVIGAGDWLSAAANSVTSYVTGRGPFQFGRRQSTSSVTADTVAEVGNGAAASVSDIYQDFGEFGRLNALSVYVKKSSSAISDIELSFIDNTAVATVSCVFSIDGAGVVTAGAVTGDLLETATAAVESAGNGWYRCSLRAAANLADFPIPNTILPGSTRRIRIRFHTTGATPANKRALLFGVRCHDLSSFSEPLPSYVYARPDLFRALTIADSTLVLNTEKTVAMAATTGTSVNPARGFVFVRQPDGMLTGTPCQYHVTIRYLLAGVLTTKTFDFVGGAALQRTDLDIAEGLRALIDADADLVATRVGSVIRIVTAATGGADQVRAVEVKDSRGDTLMTGIGSGTANGQFFQIIINKFTDLPRIMDDDIIVAVTGDPERDKDDYYVRFVGNDTGNLVGGHWEESYRAGYNLDAGILTTLDATTMPYELSRLQDDATGTVTGVPNSIYFDVSPIDWDERLVGDELSNPEPSFVGERIQDLFFHRGRLGFLAADNVILSEAGEIFNFWRSTVLDLVDTDPIDVNAGSRDVTTFVNAVGTGDGLLVSSDRSQFQLLGDPTLTPASAQLVLVRSFELLGQARPADAGRGAIFAQYDGQFSNLLEFALLRDDSTYRVDELTVAAPRYLPGRAAQIEHSTLTGLTAVRLDDDASVLHVHQTFYDDAENRLQSAPHRWTFAPGTSIRGMGFIEAELLLVVERDDGWYLESMLTNSETLEGGRHIVHLDRRADQDQLTVAYDGGTDTTTITAPWDLNAAATIQVVDAESGLLVPITGQGDDYVEVHGDLSGTDLYLGEQYTMDIGLSEPVLQAQSARGGIVALTGRPLDVHRLYLYVATTAFLRVVVEPDLRSSSAEEFSAAGLGTGLLLEGELNVFTGDADFAIIAQSTEADVSVENDTPFPSFIQSGRWEILSQQRTRLV